MEPASAETGTYAFDRFVLSPARRVVLHDGVEVPISSRLFDALLFFVRNPRKALSRDELELAVWKGRAVEEGNLPRAISSIRKILRHHSPSGIYIVTIGGHGFQFAANVTYHAEVIPPDGAPAHGSIEVHPNGADIRRAWPTLFVTGAGLVVLVLCGIAAQFLLPLVGKPASRPLSSSVAILPFSDLTDKSDNGYFGDGLSDGIIDVLSRVGGLHVVARTSAFNFKRSKLSAQKIGHQLETANVLRGTIRKDGNVLLIVAQLVDANSGAIRWTRKYGLNRFSQDVSAMQTSIASAVARSLGSKFVAKPKLTLGGTHNALAFDAFLRGMAKNQGFVESDAQQAVGYFTQAIKLDPNYAQAYAGRAVAYDFLLISRYAVNKTHGKDDARSAADDADRAIALVPDLAEAHRVKSVILFHALKFNESAREMTAAWELAPNDATVEATYATIQARLGHSQEAIAAIRHAILVDPLNPSVYRRLGQTLYWTRDYNGALAAFDHATAVEVSPSRMSMSWNAAVYIAKGDPASAETICAGGVSWTDLVCLAIVYHDLGHDADAKAKFMQLQNALGRRGSYVYAQIYAQWGLFDKALRWLQIAVDENSSDLTEIKVSPFLDPLRGFPEFKMIERKLNFPS